jgi:hypothetical protein
MEPCLWGIGGIGIALACPRRPGSLLVLPKVIGVTPVA